MSGSDENTAIENQKIKKYSSLRIYSMASLILFTALITLLIVSDVIYMMHWKVGPEKLIQILSSPEVVNAFHLSLLTSVQTLVLILITSIPIGYALSRYRFWGHSFINTFVDVPIVLPPIVLGISLLAFFGTSFGMVTKAYINIFCDKIHILILAILRTCSGTAIGDHYISFWEGIDLGVDGAFGIIICQYLVSISYCIRSVKSAFERVPDNYEDVALTLGCSEWQAFHKITIPLAMNGIIAGGIMAWARAIGVFGPLMVFVGTGRRVQVLPTHMWLHLNIGNIEAALVVSLVTMAIAGLAITFVHWFSHGRHWR